MEQENPLTFNPDLGFTNYQIAAEHAGSIFNLTVNYELISPGWKVNTKCSVVGRGNTMFFSNEKLPEKLELGKPETLADGKYVLECRCTRFRDGGEDPVSAVKIKLLLKAGETDLNEWECTSDEKNPVSAFAKIHFHFNISA